MAEKRVEPDQPGNAGDPSFVDRIVADPNNVPDLMILYGYLGASSEDGHERLYLSPDLANYVEIPASAILHRATATREQDPSGGVTLWVRKDAALIYKMAPAAQALAHYFAGAIQAQAPAAARGTPALTIGGPACGVTLPHLCQIATPICTRNTCGPACTAAGPCLTQGADCQTQAATCACTDFGCMTDVTPCINTHANTCGPCPSVVAVCQSMVGCQTAGGDCTFIGCGHTLACTVGAPLCRGAAPGAPAAQVGPAATVGGPQCAVTRLQGCQIASQACTINTCGIACTAFPPCQTHVMTCQPCASVNPTCAPFCTRFCTHLGPCPTNVTCPTACITPCISIVHPNCQTPFAPCITQGASCNPFCTPGCQTPLAPCITQVATCGIQCTIAGPGCDTRICQFETAACPQVTPACPQVTPACPPVTAACGAGMQAQGGFAAQARALPTMWAHCTQVCTQMQMGCGGGCAQGTVM
jgi:hypothetical protein